MSNNEITTINELNSDLYNQKSNISANDVLMNAEKRNYGFKEEIVVAGTKLYYKNYYEPNFSGYKVAYLTDDKQQKTEILMELKHSEKSDLSANAKKVLKTHKKLYGDNAEITHNSVEKAYNLAYEKQEEGSQTSDYQQLSDKEKKAQNRKRSARRTKKNLEQTLHCNVGNDLDKFLTLTVGVSDYKELIENNCKSKFSSREIQSLEEIKDIRNITDECLKSKTIKILGKHFKQYSKAKQKTQYTAPSKIEREVIQLLNNMIFSGKSGDWKDINSEFKNFIEKINRFNSKKFKYIAIIERQKNGKIHFHIVCNLDYIEQYQLQKKWANGFVDIRKINPFKSTSNSDDDDDDDKPQSSQDVVDYMVKYVTKAVEENDDSDDDNNTTDVPVGKQIYRCSKGLKRAQRITDKVEVEIIKKLFAVAEEEFSFDCRNKDDVNVKDFYMKLLNLNSLAVYENLRAFRGLAITKLIDKAKSKSKTFVTSDEVFDMRSDYLSNLSREINQIVYATKEEKTA